MAEELQKTKQFLFEFAQNYDNFLKAIAKANDYENLKTILNADQEAVEGSSIRPAEAGAVLSNHE
jgi:hypothetical protein